MKHITTNSELRAAIRTIVDYNWEDEARDYKEHEGEKDTHIFTVLEALDEWEAA